MSRVPRARLTVVGVLIRLSPVIVQLGLYQGLFGDTGPQFYLVGLNSHELSCWQSCFLSPANSLFGSSFWQVLQPPIAAVFDPEVAGSHKAHPEASLPLCIPAFIVPSSSPRRSEIGRGYGVRPWDCPEGEA